MIGETHKKRASLLVLATAIASLLGGCFMLPSEEEILAPPLIEPVQIEYKTTPVGRGDMVNTLQVTAYYKPASFHSLYYHLSGGRLKSVNVSLGQEVKAGDVLVELDSGAIQKRIRDQKITLEKLELNLARLEEQVPDQYAIRSAEIDLENAKNQLTDLQTDMMTLQIRYFEYKYTETKKEMMDLETRIRDQELNVARCENNLEKLLVVDNEHAISIAKLDLQAAQNAMNDLQDEYESALLRATVDGTVTYIRDMDIGSSVATFTQLITLSTPDQLVLQYDDATKAAQFPVGMDVKITINKVEYDGKVLSNPSTNPLDPNGGRQNYARFEVYGIDIAEAGIKAGTSASVLAVLDSRTNVIVVQKNQINNYLGRKFVNILEDGLKVERDVEIGLETATQVEIVRGLGEGELIILN